ncbi:RNase P modulator RnpM [Lentibacillus cibarius]|uniref:YlxR family protein n=1 Tax=Lentibacillus cibarius TaxID=2583219 RepID=A0A5S3QNY8_9BACI|nr:YlxR family protein [Lentibacillus cibarius]TMN23610.1 YlxR family protein [Lentibacillus cibarius]
MAKQRKVPQRKCIVTNEMKPKKELIRVVRNKEGEVFVDLTGKKNGRGAYVSAEQEVIEKAEKADLLSRQLNAEVDPAIYTELKQAAEGKINEK